MSNTERVDKSLFKEEHYLGKPADDSDRIISRRIDLLYRHSGFNVINWIGTAGLNETAAAACIVFC